MKEDKRTHKELFEAAFERCPQNLGKGIGNCVVVPANEWSALKKGN